MAKGKKSRQADDKSDPGSDADELKLDESKPKTKKDRKKKKEAEFESAQLEIDKLNDSAEENSIKKNKEDDDGEEAKGKQKSKGKKDKKKKIQDDSDDDKEEESLPMVKKSGFSLLMEDGSDAKSDSDGEAFVPQPVKKSKKKTSSKKSAFQQMAEMDDDDDDDGDAERVEDESKASEDEGQQSKEKTPEADDNKDKGKKKKKKGKGGKKAESDEEDLDKALADLGIETQEEKTKKKKKKKKNKDEEDDDLDKALAELRLGGGIESAEPEESESAAAKKRKEKKERQKQKADQPQPETTTQGPESKEVVAAADEEPEGDEKGKKKGKKKGGAAAPVEDKKAKKPGKGMLQAMQEALKKVQEDEERRKREEEEKIRLEEEAERLRQEQKRIEEERKALKKQREKEKKEQLRKEGKLLSAKQKQEKARAEAMLAAMRAQGIQVPVAGEKRGPRPGTRIRGNKNKPKQGEGEGESSRQDDLSSSKEPSPADGDEKTEAEIKESWDAEDEEIKESWEEVVAEDVKPEPVPKPEPEAKPKEEKKAKEPQKQVAAEESSDESDDEDESDDDDDEDDDDDDESEDDESSEEEEEHGDKRDKAIHRIHKRRELNEKNRTTNVLRAPVVCVLGHVDTGKTKILDKLRRTNVQDGEAGGITQQIGATNVPIDVIREQCKMVKNFDDVKLPGLLIIDTPGHESFSNLRDRGSSLCDIAILVVDIMHCLEPQTIESINMLKKKKVPFVIALNKIDRIYEWKSNRHKDIQEVVKSQSHNTLLEFEKRAKEVVVAMAEQGLNASLLYENPDPKSYISMVPTSAHTGEGMGNLMALLVKLSQDMLAKRLAFSEEMQATVLEVKAIPGLGTTIDIVLLNGTLREGQTMIVAGTDGPIVTQIKALLTPSKMQDLRVKNTYIEHKEIKGAQGVKIAAKDLEKAIAGLNILVAYQPDEVDILKEEIQHRLDSVLNAIKVKDRGVFVQASTLGSLEALLEFLKTSKIPFAGVKVGPVVKRDVMKASVMLEHEVKYCVILAFDVRIERDAQDMADTLGVKIFQADIIYHLFDRFTAYQEDLKRQKREEFKHVVVFPCKLRVLPNFVFKSRDPIVAGVVIEAGIVRHGTPICIPSKDFLDIGIVTSIESNHKEVETARKGEEVCIKIDPIPGESPKMFGRHFDETDILVSKISRASIDACKDYYRDDLQKTDWQLMIELKKTFGIM